MFTGLVEEMGRVTQLTHSTAGTSLTITVGPQSTLLGGAHEGDSISVSGVCLTVTELAAPDFTVGLAPETLRRTDLGSLAKGAVVNLERAVRADTRMGGHFVQGHIDCTATIRSIVPDGDAMTLRFWLGPAALAGEDVMRYIVTKGFVAIDGASLTVTAVDHAQCWWEVMLVTYTQQRIVTATKGVGDTVNVEVDMMAKYAEQAVVRYMGGAEVAPMPWLERMVARVVREELQRGAG